MSKKLYQAKIGDTLQSIATAMLGDVNRWQELAYINSIAHPYFLKPGQILQIPADDSPIEVVVTKGQQGPMGPPDPPAAGRQPIVSRRDPFMAYFGIAAAVAVVWILVTGDD